MFLDLRRSEEQRDASRVSIAVVLDALNSIMLLVLSQDRTTEFRSAVKTRLHTSRQRNEAEAPKPVQKSARSLFMKQASLVAQEISATTQMLQRLAQLAKRRAMFDDKPQEIADLTVVVKQKVGTLRDSIAALDKQTKELGGTKHEEQADTLSRNVVVTLQGKLQEITGDFTKVLEERSQNMQATRSRTGQFVTPRQTQPVSNPLYQENPFAQAPPSDYDTSAQNDELLLPSQVQAVVALEDQQSSYADSRISAVDAIESTINELGQMFSQLSTMIAEQRDTVQRIDSNTDDIALSVGSAHRELLKFYSRVSSNRGLMLKSFGIIIVMFFLWVMIS